MGNRRGLLTHPSSPSHCGHDRQIGVLKGLFGLSPQFDSRAGAGVVFEFGMAVRTLLAAWICPRNVTVRRINGSNALLPLFGEVR
jgi:hypothetical protein